MNIPTHFYLKRRRWTVEIVEDYLMWEGKRARGLACPETRTIELCGKLGPRKLLQTFLHEYLHAIEFEYDLKFPHRLIYALEGPLARMVVELIKLHA